VSDRLFALERYDRSGVEPAAPSTSSTTALSSLTTALTRLVVAVRLPADEVVLALVVGPDPETVAAAALAAGWRVDRLSPAEWMFPEDDRGPAVPWCDTRRET
jgi:hypothetical protein